MNLRAASCTALVMMGAVGFAALDLEKVFGRSPDAPYEARQEPPGRVAVSRQNGADLLEETGGGTPTRSDVRGNESRESAPQQRWSAPNGRWAVVRNEAAGDVDLVGADGRILDGIPNLMDGMSIDIVWSPRGDWFYANHYLGSNLERLRVFEVVNGTIVERSSVFAEATKVMVARYPCLSRGASVVASGHRWGRDGRRIALVAYARPDACQVQRRPWDRFSGGEWQALWMIGDAETGRIDPASVRVRSGGVAPMPDDGPYVWL